LECKYKILTKKQWEPSIKRGEKEEKTPLIFSFPATYNDLP